MSSKPMPDQESRRGARFSTFKDLFHRKKKPLSEQNLPPSQSPIPGPSVTSPQVEVEADASVTLELSPSTQRRVEYDAILDPSPHDKGAGWGALKWGFKGLEKVGKLVPLLAPLETAAGLAVDTIERIENTKDVNVNVQSMLANLKAVEVTLKAREGYTSKHVQLAVDDLAKAIEARMNVVQLKLDRWFIKKMWDADGDAKSVEQEFNGLDRALEIFQIHVNLDTNQGVAELREDSLLQKLCHVPDAEAGCGGREKCMTDTRVDLLRDLLSWAKDPETEPVLWLNGMAGTGKTTVAETLAYMLEERHLLAASFFCSRASTDRNDLKRIFPSLAYRLAHNIAMFRGPLIEAMKANENAANRDPVDQFTILIGGPLEHACKGKTSTAPIIIVMDALDECVNPETTKKLLEIILRRASALSLVVKFFITSRPERSIERAFEGDTGRHCVLRLHDIEKSIIEADIKLYMIRRLGDIPELRTEYSEDWPPPEVDMLAKRAGKLFIYASTLCAFIGDGNADPFKRFKAISNAEEATLDDIVELYAFVLETAFTGLQSEEIGERRRLLEVITFARNPLSVRDMASLLGYEPRDIRQTLAALHSVILVPKVNDGEVVEFYHASFPDYLTGPARTGNRAWAALPSNGHSYLLEKSLEICQSELHFNVAQVYDSHVPQGVERSKVFAGHLAYACQYWGDHLFSLGPDHRLHLTPVEHFLYKSFLYWLEVAIALKFIPAALLHVQKLEKSPHALLDLSEFAGECRSFIVEYKEQLSWRPAHIYLSALPWLPRDSRLWKAFGWLFPGIPVTHFTGILPKQQVPVLRIEGHTDCVNSAVFSPDDQLIVSGSDDTTVRVWDATTGEAVFAPLRGHKKSVNSVAVSPDGKCSASGSDDCTIIIWDLKTGKAIGEPLKGHTESVNSVGFSSDGKTIVSGSDDKTIRTWSAASGEPLSTPLARYTHWIESVTFSPDDKYIISGSRNMTVGVWDACTGEALHQPLEARTGWVCSIACSPDGSCVVVGSDGGAIIIWSLTTRQLLLDPLPGHTDSVISVAFSPHGGQIVSGSRDKTLSIRDSATGKAISTPVTGHTGWVSSVRFSCDGQYIVSASYDNTIGVWEAVTAHPTEISVNHMDMVLSVAFSPDGKEIISGSRDNTIHRWASESGKALADPFLGHTNDVNSVAVSRDGQILVSGSDDGTVRIWKSWQGQPSVESLEGHTDRVWCVAISDDGTYIVSGSFDKTVLIWDALTGKALGEPLEGHTDPVYAVTVSPDSELVASGSDDKTVRIWNARSGQAYGKPFEGHTGSVFSVVFSRDGKKVISGSADTTIRLWDVVTGATLWTIKGHNDAVRSIAISPDDEWFVSGSWNHMVKLWSTSTGEALSAPLVGHSDIVTSVAVSPDGRYVVSGSNDKTIRKWDVGLARRLALETSDDAERDPACQDGDGVPHGTSWVHWENGSNGWVVDRMAERLFWVPPQFRLGLRPLECNTAVIGVPYNITLDLTRFMHGKDWVKCYEPEGRPA